MWSHHWNEYRLDQPHGGCLLQMPDYKACCMCIDYLGVASCSWLFPSSSAQRNAHHLTVSSCSFHPPSPHRGHDSALLLHLNACLMPNIILWGVLLCHRCSMGISFHGSAMLPLPSAYHWLLFLLHLPLHHPAFLLWAHPLMPEQRQHQICHFLHLGWASSVGACNSSACLLLHWCSLATCQPQACIGWPDYHLFFCILHYLPHWWTW